MPLMLTGSSPQATAKRGLAFTTRRAASVSHSQSAAVSSNSRRSRLTVWSRSSSAISAARRTTSVRARLAQIAASSVVNTIAPAPAA